MLGILKYSLSQHYWKAQFAMQYEELGLGMQLAKGKSFADSL